MASNDQETVRGLSWSQHSLQMSCRRRSVDVGQTERRRRNTHSRHSSLLLNCMWIPSGCEGLLYCYDRSYKALNKRWYTLTATDNWGGNPLCLFKDALCCQMWMFFLIFLQLFTDSWSMTFHLLVDAQRGFGLVFTDSWCLFLVIIQSLDQV